MDEHTSLERRRPGPGETYLLFPSDSFRGRGDQGAGAPVCSPSDTPAAIPHPGEEFVNVRRYKAPNWATTEGVLRKRRAIEAKGLPNFKGWKFVTLTLDPAKFDHDPRAGYLAARRKISKFMFAARAAGLWSDQAKWCWKLEFHRNGWPHWHLLIEHFPKWTDYEYQELMPKIWGLGHTDVEAVRTDDYAYSFKYAFKPVIQEDDEDIFGVSSYALPDWFMDYVGTRSVKVKWTDDQGTEHSDQAEKPVTFARVRFWQTCKGFYTKAAKEDESEAKEQKTWRVPMLARNQAELSMNSMQVVARRGSGKYVASKVFNLAGCVAAFWTVVGWSCIHGQAHGLAAESFIVPVSIIKTNELWKIKEVAEQNRLTPLRAELLQPRNWRTC